MKIRLFFCITIVLTLVLFLPADKSVRAGINAGSILSVDDYSTSDLGENDGTNADAFRNTDCDDDTTTKDPEDFSDLTATLTISNTGRPNFPDSTSQVVKIYKYKVSFKKLGSKKLKRKMPKIKSFSKNTSFTIQQDSSGSMTMIIVSKAMKAAFANKYILKFNENPLDVDVTPRYLDYTAKIKIYGKEIPYNNKVDFKAEIPITLTEVDNCPAVTTE